MMTGLSPPCAKAHNLSFVLHPCEVSSFTEDPPTAWYLKRWRLQAGVPSEGFAPLTRAPGCRAEHTLTRFSDFRLESIVFALEDAELKGTIVDRGDEWQHDHAYDHLRRLGSLIHARRPNGAV